MMEVENKIKYACMFTSVLCSLLICATLLYISSDFSRVTTLTYELQTLNTNIQSIHGVENELESLNGFIASDLPDQIDIISTYVNRSLSLFQHAIEFHLPNEVDKITNQWNQTINVLDKLVDTSHQFRTILSQNQVNDIEIPTTPSPSTTPPPSQTPQQLPFDI